MTKKLKYLVAVHLIIGVLGLVSFTAFADTTPPTVAITGSTYNVSTGALVISGNNLTAKTSDYNLTKISITDGIDNCYTLTTSNKGITFKSGVVDVTLNSSDEAALANFLDKGTTTTSGDTTQGSLVALNGGTYQINVLSGWDGTASATDLSAHALSVTNIPTLANDTKAGISYDMSKGVLTLAGSDLITGAIAPKYITITDSSSNSYTLTGGTVGTATGTSVPITLNAKDKLALQSIFNTNTTQSAAKTNYNLTAAYGWDGKIALAQMSAHAVLASNYVTPTATVAASYSITYGKPIVVTANKLGTIYVVPHGITIKSISDLTGTITATPATGLKAAVTTLSSNGTAAASIPTSSFTFKAASATYDAYLVDLGGAISSASADTITINNVPAPSLSASAAKGATAGTKVTATVTKGTTDTLAYQISSSAISTPIVGTDESSAISSKTITNNYVSGSDITGVDANTNNQLAIYELNSSNQVVKFKLLKLSSSLIKTAAASATTAPSAGSITVTNNPAGANDTIALTGLSAGDVVKVYTASTGGTAIGTATVGASATTATVSVTQLGTTTGTVYVSVTSTGKTESPRTAKTYSAETSSSTPISNLSATAGDGSVTFTFSAPTGATSVVLEQSSGGDTFTVADTDTLTASSTSATVSGLDDGTEYSFKLVVTGGSFAGTSNVVAATPTAPIPGQNLSYTIVSGVKVTFNFNAVTDDSYLYYSTDGGSNWTVGSGLIRNTWNSFDITSDQATYLTVGTTYKFKLQMKTSATTTAYSNIVTFKFELPALSKVTNVQFSSSGVLTWNPEGHNGGYSIEIYKNGSLYTTIPYTHDTNYDALSTIRDGGAGVYTATVDALGDGTFYKNGPVSDISNSQTVTLYTNNPQITWSVNGSTVSASWNGASSGVTGYDIAIAGSGYDLPGGFGQTIHVDSSTNSIDLTSNLPDMLIHMASFSITIRPDLSDPLVLTQTFVATNTLSYYNGYSVGN